MWLTSNEEQELDRICEENSLTKKELEMVKTYNGFREIRKLDPQNEGPASYLFYQKQDILKKYANYTDPPEE